MKLLCTWAVWLVLVGSVPVQAADDPQAAFDELFGSEVQAVSDTPDPSDDVALAKTLLEAAITHIDDKPMMALICDKVILLAMRDPAASQLAIDAASIVARLVPDQRIKALTRIAEIRQKTYTTARGDDRLTAANALVAAIATIGDELLAQQQYDAAATQYRRANAIASSTHSTHAAAIKLRLERTLARQIIDKQIQTTRAKVQAAPDDQAGAQELLRLYLVELDDPEQARKFSFLVTDDTTAQMLRRATRPIAELEPVEAFDLAEWYRSKEADARSDAARAAMLRRSRAGYEQFIAKHGAEDLTRTKANMAIRRIDQDLASINIPEIEPLDSSTAAVDSTKWIDVMPMIDLTNGPNQGAWIREGDKIKANTERARLVLPMQIVGSYAFEVTFWFGEAKSAGLVLPVGDRSVCLAVENNNDGPGQFVGLDAVDDKTLQLAANPTRRSIEFDRSIKHVLTGTVDVKGSQAQIKAQLDGQQVVDWSGSSTSLATFRSAGPKLMSVYITRGPMTIVGIRVRVTQGLVNTGEVAIQPGDGQMPNPGGANAGDGNPPQMDQETRNKLNTIRQRFRTLPYDVQKRIILDLERSPYPEARDLARQLVNGF
jgi:TolB-like protein